MNWYGARASCQTWGGDLASIDSEEENMALLYIRRNIGNYCWTGLNDIASENVFVWSDGSNSSYRNWLSGQPGNLTNQDCVDQNVNGGWDDWHCSSHSDICHYCSSRNVTLFAKVENSGIYEELNNNTFLYENTTLYCITENRNTSQVNWSYVDLDGSSSILSSTTNVTTGVSVLTVTTDKPGYYSCQVTRDNGVSRTYTVRISNSLQIVFGTLNASNYNELSNNQILTQDTTLYCITENSNPWSYVDLAGNITALNATVNLTTGISTLPVTTDEPGYYSCQVIQGPSNATFNVGIFDFTNHTVFPSDDNATERTYTIGIDREEIFLFCNSSNSSFSLTDIMWRVTGDNRTFPNPLIPHSNMLLQNGTSYSIQCADTRTNTNILSTDYIVQGPPIITLNNGTLNSFTLLPPNMNSASVTVLTQNVVLSTNLVGRWQRPDNSFVASNTLTFPTFYVTQGGVYKFYVDKTLAIQLNIMDIQELAFNPNLTERTITIGGGIVTAECIDPIDLMVTWNYITILPENHGVTKNKSILTIMNNGLPAGKYVFECVSENMRAKNLSLVFLPANSSLVTINQIMLNENATLTETNQDIELVLSFSNTKKENTTETISTSEYETLVNATLILSKNLEGFASEVSTGTINSLVQVTSNLLGTSNTIEQENTNQLEVSTTKLVTVIEIVGAVSLSGLSANLTERIFTSEGVNLISQLIQVGNDTVDQPLTIPKSYNLEIIETVSIPGIVVQNLTKDGEFRYSIAIINVSNTSNSANDFSLGSSLLSLTVSTEKKRINLASPIELTFFTPNVNNDKPICVFLDEKNSIYNTTGLSLNSSEGNFTVCETNHLTSFGVLIRSKEFKGMNPQESLALTIISYILLSCSLIALILSILISIVIGKEFFKVEMNRIYFNYALALAFAITVFIFGSKLPRFNPIVCSVFVCLMHYFWLAVFSWGLCISIEIIYLLWIVSLNRKTLFCFLLPLGWGLPLPIVVTTVIVGHTLDNYTYIHNITDNSIDFCFLSYSNGMIWAFTGPILVMLSLNMTGLIIAFVKIILVTKTAGKSAGVCNALLIAKQSLINASLLFPVLGAPWIVLPLNLITTASKSTTVFEWIFIIINGLSGVLFFILFTLRNDIVRQKFSRKKSPSEPNSNPTKSTKCNIYRINHKNNSTTTCYSNNSVASFEIIRLEEKTITEKNFEIIYKRSLRSIIGSVMPNIKNLKSVPEDKSAVLFNYNETFDWTFGTFSSL